MKKIQRTYQWSKADVARLGIGVSISDAKGQRVVVSRPPFAGYNEETKRLHEEPSRFGHTFDKCYEDLEDYDPRTIEVGTSAQSICVFTTGYQRIGEILGISGCFLVDYGIEHIIAKLMTVEVQPAVYSAEQVVKRIEEITTKYRRDEKERADKEFK